MIIRNRIDPQPGQFFEAGCFDENIGEEVDFLVTGSDHVGVGKITSVEVASDGSHAWITVDVPNLVSDSETLDLGPVHVSAMEGPGYDGQAEEGF